MNSKNVPEKNDGARRTAVYRKFTNAALEEVTEQAKQFIAEMEECQRLSNLARSLSEHKE